MPTSSERENWPGVLRAAAQLVMSCPTPVAIWCGADHELLPNDAYAVLLGPRAAWAAGRPASEVCAEAWTELQPEFDAVLRTGAALRLERSSALATAGGWAGSPFTLSPIRDEDGRTVGILQVCEGRARPRAEGELADTRDPALAREALRVSEKRLRVLAETIPQVACVLTLDGVPEYVNRGWTLYAGLDLAGTRRSGWGGVLHPEDIGAVRACRRAVLESREPQEVEVRFRAADGTFHWFLSRLAPVIEDGRVVKLVGVALDIEERKQAELALRQQLALKDQLAKVAATVPGVICSFRLAPDGATSMPFAAPAVADLYGLPAELLARDMRPVFERVHPDDLEHLRASILASATSLSPWHDVFRFQHPRKGLRWIDGSSIPAREGDGSIVWHGYVADVTEHREAEDALRDANERLREADRRKDEFLGVLSHELRNPLAPIRNALYIMDHVVPSSPQALRAKEILDRQVSHLTRLVDDLLDVTRIARGKIRLQREQVDLAALARRCVEDLRPLFANRGVAVSAGGRGRVLVDGDETRLAQVLGNVLHNALKFTPGGGQVTVTVEVEGGVARVRVKDTGAGMDAKLLGALFEPFMQGAQTLARTEGGLGLGLALVKGLVELHGGAVQAFSEGLGRGSEIVVSLPLLLEPARPSEGAAPVAESAPHARKVLVVDDNHDAADSLAQIVSLLGHQVDVAYEGETALAKARTNPPDVVLCDIGLPGMDGYAVARELRRAGPSGVRLVAVTGYARPEDVARAADAGFEGHVAKPPNPEAIRSVLG